MKISSCLAVATLVAAWTTILAQVTTDPDAKKYKVGEMPEVAKPSEAYLGRVRGTRGLLETEKHVTAALDWLVDHQARDGSWSTHEFRDHSTRSNAARTYNIEFHKPGDEKGDLGWDGETKPVVGLTGLCLMAFTAAGYDHKTGAYAVPVRRALDFLLEQQQPDGSFLELPGSHWAYEQATATIAVAELYGLTGDYALQVPLEYACTKIKLAQNPGMAWRYEPVAAINDTHCTGYLRLALQRCLDAGISVDTAYVDQGVLAWFDAVCIEVSDHYKTGYDSPGGNNARLRASQDFENNETMDALHGNVRLWLGKELKTDRVLKDLRESVVKSDQKPRWKQNQIDMQFWFWAAMFTKKLGGEDWQNWRANMDKVLVENQRGFRAEDEGKSAETLDEYGSWDAVECWSTAGGRPYTTAMGAMLLCVDLQHFKPKKAKKTTVTGR